MILNELLIISTPSMLIELSVNGQSVNELCLTTANDLLNNDRFKALLMMNIKHLSLEKNGICRYALKIELENDWKRVL